MKKFLFFSAILLMVLGLMCNSGISKQQENNSKNAAEKMQDFVVSISKYARKYDSNFIIIPQNGEELIFQNAKPTHKINSNYLDAIDGIGVEELFFNEIFKPNEYRLKTLRQIAHKKTILVSDFVSDDNDVKRSIEMNSKEGFESFVRTKDNYHYLKIPTSIEGENHDDIQKLSEAKNFLYLINSSEYPTKATFLKALKETNYDVLLIDLFYNGMKLTADEINSLQVKANGGKRLVIAYMNIGAAEKYRYYWNKNWQLNNPEWLAKAYIGYDQEIWVHYWNKEWQEIIFGNDDSYLKKIINAKFDGVYLDNIEAYYFLFNE